MIIFMADDVGLIEHVGKNLPLLINDCRSSMTQSVPMERSGGTGLLPFYAIKFYPFFGLEMHEQNLNHLYQHHHFTLCHADAMQ